MPVFDFLNHLLNFVAPAIGVALMLAVGARCCLGAKAQLLRWYWMAAVNAVLGILVLALGLVLTGQDGRMLTYGALVLAMGSCQWLMSGAWRT